MPLYEYQCGACGHRFEKIQKLSDALEDTCPQCGGVVRKLISSPAIQFKGSGFYITDYAKKDYQDASKADGKPADEGKSDGSKADKTEKPEKSDKSVQADTSSQSGTSEQGEKSASSSDSAASSSASTTKP